MFFAHKFLRQLSLLYIFCYLARMIELIFYSFYSRITVLTITTTINSLCYGKLTISLWEFLKANIFQNVSGFYGILPWYWYFTVGLPTILGVHTLPFVWSLFKLLQNGRYKTNELVLIMTIIFTLCVYSFIPHKEFRFMLPILPMCLYICVDYLAPWSSKINRYVCKQKRKQIFCSCL